MAETADGHARFAHTVRLALRSYIEGTVSGREDVRAKSSPA
jgi:hypothetical protein